ncbi:MAG: hypothetical protein H7328_10535 [Bdellovibrio sp.]|nr:hypothetical protein [Bdellovibrio sp.]
MLRIISEKKDRYRPLFCERDFYVSNQSIFGMWKTHFADLSNVEKVQAWVFTLTCLRRPNDWFGSIRKEYLISDICPDSKLNHLSLRQTFQDTPVNIPLKLDPQLSILSALNILKIKPLPETCLRSLCQLSNPQFPLIILEHIPSPYELLGYQLKGLRVVSFNENYQTWSDHLNIERDFLSFIIHDLIHADHFFKDNKNKNGQLGFYHFIEKIWLHESLHTLLLSSEFKKGFEYIISDMNSHPLHLLKTLRAYLSQAVQSPNQTEMIWNSWVSAWTHEPTAANALQKINTQLFSDIDALEVEKLCIAVGQKKLLGEFAKAGTVLL